MTQKANAPDDLEKSKSKEVRFGKPTFNPDQLDERVEFMSPLSLRECIRRLEGKSSPAAWKGDRVWQTDLRHLSPGRCEFHLQRKILLKFWDKDGWFSPSSVRGILQYWDDNTTLVIYGKMAPHDMTNLLRSLAPFSIVFGILIIFMSVVYLRPDQISLNNVIVVNLIFALLVLIPGLFVFGESQRARRTDSQKLADLIGELLRA